MPVAVWVPPPPPHLVTALGGAVHAQHARQAARDDFYCGG
jgi:hypothetical protein